MLSLPITPLTCDINISIYLSLKSIKCIVIHQLFLYHIIDAYLFMKFSNQSPQVREGGQGQLKFENRMTCE